MANLNFSDAPQLGDLPTKLSNGVSYVWDGAKWSQAGGSGGGGSNINSGEYPPSGGLDGDMWFNTDNGILYVYYVDSDGTGQWVDSRPGGSGSNGISGGDAPYTGQQYGRQDGNWTLTDVDIDRFEDLPSS